MSAPGRQRNQPKAPRPDPEPRSLDGAAGDMALEGSDPNKKYVWVNRDRMQLREYRRMGYRPETYRDGGVRPAGEDVDMAVQATKEIESCDHILMSISQEKAQQIFESGPFGATGQKLQDALDSRIVKKKGGKDFFRGIGVKDRPGQGPYFRLNNETTSLHEEDDGDEES